MSDANTIDELERFDRIIERFRKQRASGIQYLSFLTDLSENDTRWEKYRDSFSGKIIHLAIVSIENSLILFCSRLWDTKLDSLSIPNAMTSARASIELICDRHRRELNELNAPFTSERFESLLSEIGELYEQTSANPTRGVIRIMRTESLAHLLNDSRDRSAAYSTRQEYEDHGVTRNDLFAFADTTLRLVDDLIYLQSRTASSYKEQIEHFQRDVRKFWNCLPVLRDVEE